MGTPIVYAVISLVVGLLLVFIRAIFVYMNIPYAYYLGFLCIPFILYGIWGFILDRELPRWLVTSSFGVYLIHKFVLFFVSRVIDVNSGALAYFCCAIIAFLVSIIGVVLLRISMPKVARLMLGGR
jgi:peptidoglycan/LPS O-acetylase OafA/YrhL